MTGWLGTFPFHPPGWLLLALLARSRCGWTGGTRGRPEGGAAWWRRTC